MADHPHRRPARTATRVPLGDDPVSVRSAREQGWTPAAQRHAVARGDLRRVRRGVLAPPPPVLGDESRWSARQRALLHAARAAAVSSPRAVISHVPAAITLGLPTLCAPQRPCLTVQAGTALRRVHAAHLHRATLLPEDVIIVGGYAVTSPARTVLDIAREHGSDAGVVAADHALRSGLVDARALSRAFGQCAGWPGRRAAGLTVQAADGAAESPLESLSRLRLGEQRIPAPRLQATILDVHGVFHGRCDFYWDEFGVVGEADGDRKYDDGRPAVVAERRRQQALEDLGLVVVRWGWGDLARFATIAARLRTAFGRGAPPGSPARAWIATP